MPVITRSLTAVTLFLGSAHAVAASPAEDLSPTHCITVSECELNADLRDSRARNEEWQRNVRNQEDAHAAAMQARFEAGARAAGNKEAKLEAILQRRRDAYDRLQH